MMTHRKTYDEEEAVPLVAIATNSGNRAFPVNNRRRDSSSDDLGSKDRKSARFCTPKVLFSCTLFMIAGPFLIMINKTIITELNFSYPVIVTSLGISSSSLIVHALHRLGYISIRSDIKKLVTWRFLLSRIFVISFLQSLTMYFGNKTYLFLSVSLIQMLKAFTPVLTMFLLFLSGQSSPTAPLVGAILLLSFGTAITSTGAHPDDANLSGFTLAAGAQLTEALKLTLQQKLLQGFRVKRIGDRHSVDAMNDKSIRIIQRIGDDVEYSQKVKFTTFEGLYYYAPMTFVSICLIVGPLELGHFAENWKENTGILTTYWFVFVTAGLLGFAVNVAAFMVTKVTSGLYLKALNAFRNVCLVVACVLVFGDVVTGQQVLGYMITMIGFAYYNYIKLQR